MSGQLFDYAFKIALIGDAGVGKSALMARYVRGRFFDGNRSTVGVDYATKTLVLDNLRIKLEVWDTAGQERFRTITHSYYRNANGLILAYDITNCDSMSGLSTWLNDIKLYASPDVLICLVGTKKDLESKREVSEEQAKTFAAKHSDIVDVIETSAKEDVNIDKVFEKLVGELRRKYEGIPARFSSSIKVVERSMRKENSPLCALSCCTR